MKTFTLFAALIAGVTAQAVTENIAPKAPTPAGCSTSYNGVFQVTVEAISTPAKPIAKREPSVPLEMTLKNGILLDALNRTGYIASNRQFQFDGPAQSGAIYTAGWSVCTNGSLALGGSAVFYQCLSGSFYNLYDQSWAEQCSPIYLIALGSTTHTGTGASAVNAPTVTAGTHTVICQIGDGQIQHNTCITTALPVAENTAGRVIPPVVTQIGDGQIQAPVNPAKPSSVTNTITVPVGQAPPPTTAPTGAIPVPTNGTTVAITTRTPAVTLPVGSAPVTTVPVSQPSTSFTGAAAPTLRAELYGLVAGVIAFAAL